MNPTISNPTSTPISSNKVWTSPISTNFGKGNPPLWRVRGGGGGWFPLCLSIDVVVESLIFCSCRSDIDYPASFWIHQVMWTANGWGNWCFKKWVVEFCMEWIEKQWWVILEWQQFWFYFVYLISICNFKECHKTSAKQIIYILNKVEIPRVK